MYPTADFDDPQAVMTTTLDDLIAEFGIPRFVKIDVEGFEYSVLYGLSDLSSIPEYLCFEFHGSRMDVAIKCIGHLIACGYTLGDWTVLDVDPKAEPAKSIDQVIDELKAQKPDWGNIMVKL